MKCDDDNLAKGNGNATITKHVIPEHETMYKFYAEVFDHAPDGLSLHKIMFSNNKATDFLFIYTNASYEKLVGQSNIKGKYFSKLFIDHTELCNEMRMVSVNGTARKFDYFFKPLNRWFSISAYCPQKDYIITTLNDITQQKKSSKALADNEKKFRNFFNDDISGNVIFNTNGIIKDCNPAFLKIFEFESKKQVIGTNISFLHHNTSEFNNIIEKLNEKGKLLNYKTTRLTKKDNLIHIIENLIATKDEAGNITEIKKYIFEITNLKKQQEALSESEARFKSIFYENKSIIMLIDPETGKIEDTNQTACEFYGYKNLTSMKIQEINQHPDYKVKQFMDSSKSEQNNHFIFKHKLANNTVRDVEVFTTLLKIKNKRRLLSIIHDITDRIKAEKQLKETTLKEKELADIVRKAPLAIAYGYPDGRLDNCNDAFLELTGYTIDELKAIDWNKVLTPAKWEILESEKLNELVKTKKSVLYEKEYITKDGIIVPIELMVAGKFDSDGNLMNFIGFIRDITNRKKAQQDLQESETKYRQLVEKTNTFISIVDGNGLFIYVNHLSDKLFGLTPDECIGKSAFDFIHPDDKAYTQNEFEKWVSSGTDNFTFSNRQVSISGEIHHIFWNIHIKRNTDGETLELSSIGTDITSQKHAELKIKEQNVQLVKLISDKDRFLKILAHDLKSPFNALLGLSNILIKNLAQYELNQIQEMVEVIYKTSYQTFELLEQLLLWAKKQDGKLELEPTQISMNTECEKLIRQTEIIARKKNITIQFLNSEQIQITTDLNILTTVMRNLISNAIKFTNTNGVILISADTANTETTITVSDNGVGIEKNEFEKLWNSKENYSKTGTNNEKGTGFGLKLCKKLIELQGGKIWVESEVGVGSNFKFTILNKQQN